MRYYTNNCWFLDAVHRGPNPNEEVEIGIQTKAVPSGIQFQSGAECEVIADLNGIGPVFMQNVRIIRNIDKKPLTWLGTSIIMQ